MNLCIGVAGVMIFDVAQRLFQPLHSFDHRHLDAMVWWLLFVLAASAIGAWKGKQS